MYVLIPANVDKATKAIKNGRTLNLLPCVLGPAEQLDS